MRRRLKVAWALRRSPASDSGKWFQYLIGLYPLAEWEEKLLLLPSNRKKGTVSL